MTRTKTIEEKAMLWALNGNHLRVYPVPVDENYKTKNKLNKSDTINKVKLVIEHGNSTIEGKLLYKQDREMTEAIQKLYVYYYERRS